MSDFASGAPLPPPPPSGASPQYAPPTYAPPPPGYSPYQQVAQQKPPRPAVKVGSLLLMAGSAVMVLGSALTWYTIAGDDLNGFQDTFDPDTGRVAANTGGVFVFLAVVLLGFGIAQLAARRVLPVAILAVVFATFSVLGVVGEMSNTTDRKRFVEALGLGFETGVGQVILLVGTLAALAGAIATLSRRRRWPTV